MISASDRRIIHHRAEELFREVGALLIALVAALVAGAHAISLRRFTRLSST